VRDVQRLHISYHVVIGVSNNTSKTCSAPHCLHFGLCAF